jgi:hypothetical protein
LSSIPGSRVAGIGPTQRVKLTPYGTPGVTPSGVIVTPVERPEHRAARQRTPEEEEAVRAATIRRSLFYQAARLGTLSAIFGEGALHFFPELRALTDVFDRPLSAQIAETARRREEDTQ